MNSKFYKHPHRTVLHHARKNPHYALAVLIGLAAYVGLSALILRGFLSAPVAHADITAGLVGWWKLDDASGTNAVDSSSAAAAGTLNSGTTVCSNPPTAGCPTWTAGIVGGALSFDGIDDNIKLTQQPLFNLNNWTISAWIKLPSPTPTTPLTIYSETLSGNAHPKLVFTFEGANHVIALLVDSGIQPSLHLNAQSVSTINDNNWHHVVAQRTGNSSAAFYIDGIDAGTVINTAGTPGAGSPNQSNIGWNPGEGSGDYWSGTLDDVRLYNRVLPPAEIQSIYAAGSPPPTGGQLKTTEFYVYDAPGSVSTEITPSDAFSIGDTIAPGAIKSAFIRVSGVYTGGGTVTLKLNGGNSQQYSLPSVTAPAPFEFLYDASGVLSPLVSSAGSYSYPFDLTPSGVTLYGLGAKMELTYQYAPPSCSTDQLKTTQFYVYDSSDPVTSTSPVSGQTFSASIGDTISAGAVKSAFIRVSGIYTGSGNVGVTVANPGNGASVNPAYTLPPATAAPFEVLLDASSVVNPSSAGSYGYTFGLSPPGGMTLYGLGAKMELTYQYTPAACLPVHGELTSTVFDTTGSNTYLPAYNSIMWEGNLNGGRVRFQIATSNDPAGPWTFYGNSGSGCQTGDWYDGRNPDSPVEITCAPPYHDNQRYFKYRVQICSHDCAAAGSASPTVNRVIVNWSP